MLEKDIEKVLISREEISQRCVELGAVLTEEYQRKNPLVIGVLTVQSHLWRILFVKWIVS